MDVNAAPAPPLMTMREVAEALRLSEATLHRMVRRGELEPIYFGRAKRFKRSDVMRFVTGEDNL
jgi:excisionase family DNA binding protein